MHPYRKLLVWQRAHAVVVALYRVDTLDVTPRNRSLGEQIRRCAASISGNIAEGAGAGSQAMFARYLGIALASAYELECHLLLARDIGALPSPGADSLAEEVEALKRMLTVLVRKVRSNSRSHRLERKLSAD